MKKLILASLIILAGGMTALSATPLEFRNSVGIYGLIETNVLGIQYERWCTDKLGFATQGYVFYNPENSQRLDFSVSGEFHIKLFETEMGKSKTGATNLYAWLLAGFHGFQRNEWIESTGTYGTADYVPAHDELGDFKGNAMLGIGFGFDIMFLNHISIPVQFGFEGEFPNDSSAGFCAGLGLRYRF